MGKALADDVQLALEGFLVQPVSSPYKQLLDLWLRHARCRADVCAVGINRHHAPAQQGLAFFGDNLVDGIAAEFTLFADLWQEDVADRVLALFWQCGGQLLTGNVGKKGVGQRHQDTGAVTGVGFKATAAAVIHARVQVIGVQHDLMTGATFNVCNKTDAAGVFFTRRVIESVLFREAKLVGVLGLISHKSLSLVMSLCYFRFGYR